MNGIMYVTNFNVDHIASENLHTYIHSVVKENDYSFRSKISIEPKASGKTVVGLIKRYLDLNVVEYQYPRESGVTSKNSKVERAKAITHFIESGKVKLLYGNWNAHFLDQIAKFPKSENDDMVDCLVMGVLEMLLSPRRATTMRVN